MCNNIMYVFLLISLVYVVFTTFKIHVQVLEVRKCCYSLLKDEMMNREAKVTYSRSHMVKRGESKSFVLMP